MEITVNTIKQASHYLLLCILVLGLSSCHKDIDETGESTSTQTPTNIVEITQGDIVGYVYDENNQPISDVQVSVLGRSTTTDASGVYVFRNTDLDKNGTYIRATKSGYVLGSDLVYPNTAKTNHSYIKMLSLSGDQSLSATNGGVIPVTGGGSISFAPASIVNSAGDVYNGTVTVTAKRIASDDKDLQDVMPGGLVAEDLEGYTRVLGTFGMVAVELRDADGEELNLAPGTTAEVVFPIAQDLLSTAPEQIKLWSFDEDKGIWKEDGFATKDGDSYKGQVSHFSFWNCDAPFPLIHVCGIVIGNDGLPLPNVLVEVSANVSWGVGYGYTDSEGNFCGKMPKGEELQITVHASGCDNIINTITVGPFENDTALEPIVVNTTIHNGYTQGNVQCNGVNIENATVVIIANGDTHVYLAEQDGLYSIPHSVFNCDDISEATIYAINNATGEASLPATISIDGDATLNLNTCGECDLEITSEILNTDPCDESTYYAEVTVTGGSGSYDYAWFDGSTGATNENLIAFGQNCVTVTDVNADCSEVLCIQNFTFQNLADSIVFVNPSCDLPNGSLFVVAYDGVEPYTYEINNDQGITISTQSEAYELAAGVYTYTVTDANGCSFSGTVTLVNTEGTPPEPIVSSDCEFSYVSFVNSTGNQYTIFLDGQEIGQSFSTDVEGEYCFTVVDELGCEYTDLCVDLFIMDVPPPVFNVSCDFPFYTVDFGGDIYQGFYENSVTSFDFDFAPAIQINPVLHGYNGNVFLSSPNGACSYDQWIQLPVYNGLSAMGNSPSCADCEDGFIEIVLDNADCIGCIAGDTKIYAQSDIDFNTDLTGFNGELTAGNYYVVVLDEETGCIVAHKFIEL